MAKYYYNGVLLPEIPHDYPYALYGVGTDGTQYCWVSSVPWYSTTTFYQSDGKVRWYQLVDGGWKLNLDTTVLGVYMPAYTILWSSHDIPDGSATATAIYFYSTYPIPEADECYYNGVRLPAIPSDVLLQHPYCVMYRNSAGTQFLLAGPNKWWANTSNNRLMTDNATTYVRYELHVDSAWVYDNSWTDNGQLPFASIDWSNHDIRNGSATSTTIYFRGNSPVPVVQEPDVPAVRTSGYLIRSGSTIYTVVDGALSALTETEVTASLFQTYGVDEIPDGVLLATLTDPEVLFWQESEEDLPTLTLTVTGAPPIPQIITSDPIDLTHESIAGIDHAAVDASEDVRFAISFDDGASWKAFDGFAWFTVSDTAPGMLASTMNTITAEQWAEVVQLTAYRLRFWLPNVTAFVKSVVIHYINP